MDWYYVATVVYGLVDLLFVEIGLSLFFKKEKKGHVKSHLFPKLKNDKRMSLYTWAFVVYGLIFFVFSNLVQEPVVSKFMLLEWRLFVFFFVILAFDIYWIARTISSKRKPFGLLRTSSTVLFVSVAIWILSYVFEWYMF